MAGSKDPAVFVFGEIVWVQLSNQLPRLGGVTARRVERGILLPVCGDPDNLGDVKRAMTLRDRREVPRYRYSGHRAKFIGIA